MSFSNKLTKPFQTMSVWRRELFKWNKADTERDKQSEDVQPLITLGKVDSTNADLKTLFSGAIHGRKKEIVEVMQKGLWVDHPNDAGQTALFCATLRGHYQTSLLLLQQGADPNEKSDTGMTPVHVACMKANLRVLGAMIEAGGDLRLHDNEGNGCLEWTRFHPDPRKRMKMIEFLQRSQLFALNYSGDFVGNTLERQPSILQMLRGKVSSQMSLDFNQETGLRRVHSHGYGRVYYGGDSVSGVVSVIPLLTENQLRQDTDSFMFESTFGFEMVGMLWNMTPITVKQPSDKMERHLSTDLLISEVEHLSKLRHPNVFLLMGLCQSSSFDKIMLAFERVSMGSLYHILHEKIDHLMMTYIRDICSQVCQALVYIHAQNLIHCALTSHAVFMVTMHQAKVGNLEYMVETKKASTGRTCLAATNPHKQHLYRWMAPEILMGDSPSAASDIYSFCCILWEMMTSDLPWKSHTEQQLYELHKSGGACLVPPPKSVVLFQTIVEEGLRKDVKSRPMNFTTLLRWFQGPLDKTAGWKPSPLDRLKSLQRESKERISVGQRLTTPIMEMSSTTSTSTSISSSSTSSSTEDVPEQKASINSQLGPSQTPSGQISNAKTSSLQTSSSSQATKRSATKDTTNNHRATDQHVNASNSCSEKGSEPEVVDIRTTSHDTDRNRPVVRSAGQIGIQHLTKGAGAIAKNLFERSNSTSAMQKYSRRTASLPWQRSVGVLGAGRTSSSHLSKFQGHHHLNVSAENSLSERSSKTLPLVKPASHSTDVKDFGKEQAADSPIAQGGDHVPRRTRRHSPRRSLPSRNWATDSPGMFPRSKSASGDVLELEKDIELCMSGKIEKDIELCMSGKIEKDIELCMSGKIEKDIELSVPGSVRTLTEQFQAQLYYHSLRQSILKGSMTPQGTMFDDLDTSPICLKQTPPNFGEVPPEGIRENANNPDSEMFTLSSAESTESLTSVSLRDESSADEDENNVCPTSTRNELDVSAKVAMSKPSPIYPPYPAKNLQSQLAACSDFGMFQKMSAFRKISKQKAIDPDHTDGCSEALSLPLRKYQFLPSSLPGTDISSHPFDFEDYYIDDEYDAGINPEEHNENINSPRKRACEATHITSQSRQRVRSRVWLGDNNKEQKKKRERGEENWRFVQQRLVAEKIKQSNHFQKRVLRQQALELDENGAISYRKKPGSFENSFQSENSVSDKRMDPKETSPEEPENEDEGEEQQDQRTMLEETFVVECSQRDDRKSPYRLCTDTNILNQDNRDEEETELWQTANNIRESRWEEFVRQSHERSVSNQPNRKHQHGDSETQSDGEIQHYGDDTQDSGGENQDFESANQDYEDENQDFRYYSGEIQNYCDEIESGGEDKDCMGEKECEPDVGIDAPDNANPLSFCRQNASNLLSPEELEDSALTASGESSLCTVLEKPVMTQSLMSETIVISDDDNDEDNHDVTLTPDDDGGEVKHSRCIVLNLERNTLSQEEIQPLDFSHLSPTEDDNDSQTSLPNTTTTTPNTGKTTQRSPRTSTSPQSTLRKFYLSSSGGGTSQGYSTTLKVESSLVHPGTHRITQTARDTGTGVTQTVHEETVQADTLRTTMSIQ